MWHFSHFVSLFFSPVTLLGYTLMTAQQFQFHSALNLRYLSWDVAGNHSSPLLHVPSLKLNLLKEMHFWEKNNKGTCKFRRLHVILFFLFFCRYLGWDVARNIRHHSSSSFYVQFKLNLLRAARFWEKITRVHANFVALHVIFFLSKLNQLRHLRGHAPKKRPRISG